MHAPHEIVTQAANVTRETGEVCYFGFAVGTLAEITGEGFTTYTDAQIGCNATVEDGFRTLGYTAVEDDGEVYATWN